MKARTPTQNQSALTWLWELDKFISCFLIVTDFVGVGRGGFLVQPDKLLE